jgi:hypothetical protein
MARIPADELARLKSLPIADLVGRRVQLVARGQDLVGCCPFHDDSTPSLVVTPAKNLWHCRRPGVQARESVWASRAMASTTAAMSAGSGDENDTRWPVRGWMNDSDDACSA